MSIPLSKVLGLVKPLKQHTLNGFEMSLGQESVRYRTPGCDERDAQQGRREP